MSNYTQPTWIVTIHPKNKSLGKPKITMKGPAGWIHLICSDLSQTHRVEMVSIRPKGYDNKGTVYGIPIEDETNDD